VPAWSGRGCASPTLFEMTTPLIEAGKREPSEVHTTLDARGWEPPEPMVRMLEALEALPRGRKIVMLLHREPRPLFLILKNSGFHCRSRLVPEGHFEVTVWHAADVPAPRGSPE
jgi:tRNA 2-thiouridine synthesizing protein A